MSEASQPRLRRVLPSAQLPRAEGGPAGVGGRVRQRALAATVPAPVIRQVSVGSAEVLLARLPGGTVVAFGTRCPHHDTPLVEASIYEGNVRCPRHNYVYDPRTGRNILPSRDARPEALPRLKPGYLRTHRVEERDGWVWVAEEPNPPPPDHDAHAQAPPGHRGRQRPEPVERAAGVGGPPRSPGAVGRTQPAGRANPVGRVEAAGPGTAAASPGEPVERPAQSLRAAAGCDLELLLPTDPLPGHLWRVEVDGDVALLGQTYEQAETLRYRIRLRAGSPGKATVRCAYTLPWSATPKEVRTYRIDVT